VPAGIPLLIHFCGISVILAKLDPAFGMGSPKDTGIDMSSRDRDVEGRYLFSLEMVRIRTQPMTDNRPLLDVIEN
jgi:hypothetical protein